jgi:hypothetical protein
MSTLRERRFTNPLRSGYRQELQVKIAGGWKSSAWELRVPRAVRRRILKMAATGMSQRAIAEKLNAGGQ